MAIVSRLQISHPALGTAGGAALHTQIEDIYKKIGDNMADRYFVISGLANAASTDLEHNFKTDFDNLRFDVYQVNIGTGDLIQRLTSTTTPPISQLAITATGGFVKTKATITNTSGSSQDLAVVIIHEATEVKELADVDLTTAPEDGQALVYNSTTSDWRAGASGDSSFKAQSVTTPNLSLKGGYAFLSSKNMELATWDGAGALSTDFGKDLTLNLTTILGGAPANATPYYLYIDIDSLSAPVTQTDTGRIVYAVVQANFVLSLNSPEAMDIKQYLPIGFIKSATTGNVWSGAGAAVGTFAKFRSEVPLGIGESSEYNWIKNPRAFNNTDDWAAYADASQIPVDGTGGSPLVTWARSTTSPLSGRASFIYSKPASNRQGDGVAGTAIVPSGWQVGRKCLATLLIDTTAANYATGRVKLYVYDVTNSRLITPSNPSVPKMKGPWTINWDSNKDGAEYRFLIHQDSNDTDAYDLKFDEVTLSPGETKTGGIVGPIIQFRPEFGGTTADNDGNVFGNAGQLGWYQRLGNVMIGSVHTQFTSPASPPTGNLTWKVPGGYRPDQSFTGNGTDGQSTNPIGHGTWYNSGAAAGSRYRYLALDRNNPSVDDYEFVFNLREPGVDETQLGIPGNPNEIDFTFSVPIAEWAGQNEMLLGPGPDVEYAYNTASSNADDTTSFATGMEGGDFPTSTPASIIKRRVEFQYPIQSGDDIRVVVNVGGTKRLMPLIGYVNKNTDDYAIPALRNRDGGGSVSAGAGFEIVDSTHVDVWFGTNPNSFTGYTSAWNSMNTDGHSWLVVKAKPGALVGVELASEERSGLVKPYDTNDGVVNGGIFTPGLLGSSNIDGVTNLFLNWSRVGPIVTCHFYADVDANTTGPAYFDFTLPVPSNFAAATDMLGHGSNVFDQRVSIFGSPAPNTGRMSFVALVLTATTWSGSFSYNVLE